MLFWKILLVAAIGWIIYLVYVNVQYNKNTAQNAPKKSSVINPINSSSVLDIPPPKKWQTDVSSAQMLIKKFRESYKIMETTTNPEIFFSRLNVCYDFILELMTYKIKFGRGCTPEDQYMDLKLNMEKYVDNMVDRCYAKALEQASNLKTEKGRMNKIIKCFETLDNAFENAITSWEGSALLHQAYQPQHYTGELYTQNNIKRLYDLKISAYKKYGITDNENQ